MSHPSPYHGHPFHAYGWGRWHRGPSRIFWFLLGGFATAWWLKHKEGYCQISSYHRRGAIESGSVPPETVPGSAAKMEHEGRFRPWRSAPSPAPASCPASPPPPSPSLLQSSALDGWEAERARVRELGRQANDTMTELSEAALDTALSNIQALKAKIAENRTQRDKLYREQLDREKEPIHRV